MSDEKTQGLAIDNLAVDLAREKARVKELLEALQKIKKRGHRSDCGYIIIDCGACTCGYEMVCAAIARAKQ